MMIMASEPDTFVKVKSIGDFDMNENDVVQVANYQDDITGIEVRNKDDQLDAFYQRQDLMTDDAELSHP